MATSPPWYTIASDQRVVRRAIITGLGVGTILTLANRADELARGSMTPVSLVAIAITYVVPFIVSIVSSIIALRVERRNQAVTSELLEREIDAINRFPSQNPNPVLRITRNGRLTYANEASAPVRAGLGMEVGASLDAGVLAELREAAAATPPRRVEVTHGRQTFALAPVWVEELDVYNVYGTDVTAWKVVERFPDRNPNPVLRMTLDGELKYANAASAPIVAALELKVGDRFPTDLLGSLREAVESGSSSPIEVAGEGRTYRLDPVVIPEFEFINVYGTDVTALHAFDKFPNENPNPVLRLDRQGRLTYANSASATLRKALAAEVGELVAPEVFKQVADAAEGDGGHRIELEADGRLYSVRVVSLFEFESINLYGTDITAARQVEELSAANEKLLLNILPPSIAARLRGGETVIADRFEDMAVLFADVVGFTELSSRLSPFEVIELLNRIFTACDELADRYGLEKIKTVGDAYMVVGGIGHHVASAEGDAAGNGSSAGAPPDGRDGHDASEVGDGSHAEDVADMGLAMLDAVRSMRAAAGMAIEIRIGMHVGPAVAGVIGLKKFIYDVWGDTVNTASRMESTGVPGRIQVAGDTYERLRDRFDFERRGMVEVKGKGQIETWFLVRRRKDATSGDAVGAAAAGDNRAR